MKRLLLCLTAVFCGLTSFAQLLTWTPPFPEEANASQSLVITMDATKGNGALQNYTPTSNVYVHIGVITTLSTSSSDWRYVPFTWATTPAAAQTQYTGANKWSYTINGSLRTFFGITDPNERIRYISILFRNGDGTVVQRNSDLSDMYIPIYNNTSLAVRIDQPFREPRFVPVAEATNWTIGSAITLNAKSNKTSTITLFHNGTQVGTASGVTTLTANSTITGAGNQQIIAVANDGTTSKSDTINIFVAPASGSPVVALPAGLKDGINYEPGDTSVILVLRAPGKNIVTVTAEWNNWTPQASDVMNKTPDGKFFWTRVKGLLPGKEYAYQFVIDNGLKIADPYAEKILDPFNDQFITAATYPALKPYPAGQSGIVSVLQTAAPQYNWSSTAYTRPDKRGLVIYELLVRDFVSAHSWQVMRDTLNYLKKLGINAIELMPVNEFEGNESWGYNPSFYFAPDKYYGPANEFKRFIDSAHSKGIAIILDVALNHSFGQSPMVQMYFDAASGRPAANNPWYNPSAKHAFNVGYDMNHQSLDTRYFVSRVVEHWLQQYKVDGFRFDLSKGFTQVQTCDANGNNCDVGQWGNTDTSRISIWKRYYDTTQLKSPGSYAILEHFASNQEEIILADYGMMFWGNLAHAYQQAAKGKSGSDITGALHTARGWSKPHLISYMESHDEERLMYSALMDGAIGTNYNVKDTTTALKRMELTAALFFTMPGPKMIWQFGELGYPYSINTCTNLTVSNDCRLANKPIRWDYLLDPRRKKVYDVYSKLINLRMRPEYREAFMSGTVDHSLAGNIKWLKLTSGDSSRLLVVGNFDVNVQTATVSFQNPGNWFEYFTDQVFSATGSSQNITLQPGEYRVYINRNLNNVPVTPIMSVPLNGDKLAAMLFPNPSRGEFSVRLDQPTAAMVVMEMFDGTGRLVQRIHEGRLPRGQHQVPVRGSFTAGMYYIKIRSGNETRTLSITIQ